MFALAGLQLPTCEVLKVQLHALHVCTVCDETCAKAYSIMHDVWRVYNITIVVNPTNSLGDAFMTLWFMTICSWHICSIFQDVCSLGVPAIHSLCSLHSGTATQGLVLSHGRYVLQFQVDACCIV